MANNITIGIAPDIDANGLASLFANNPHAYAQYGSQTQTKDTMWKPKNEEIVFSLKVTKDFRFTSTKLEWANNDKVLQRALEQGVIFRYADEALELCRKMNYLIDNFKNSENEK